MKNKEFISGIIEAFEKGDFDGAEQKCQRLIKNFNLYDDEITFNMDAKVFKPYSETCKRLIEKGQANLIGDPSLINKKELRISVVFKSKQPVLVYGDDDDDDGNTNESYYQGQYRIGFFDNKICVTGGTACCARYYEKGRVKKLISKWLKGKFGACFESEFC